MSEQVNIKRFVCILARKRLFRNTRVVRQAKALADAGHSVTVVAIELPSKELQNLTPQVEYIEVTITPLLNRIMPYCNKLRLKCLKIYEDSIKKKLKLFYKKSEISSLPKKNSTVKPVPPIRQFNPLFSFLIRPFFLCILFPLNPKALFNCSFIKMTDAELFRAFLIPYFNIANSYDFAKKTKAVLGRRSFEFYQAHDTHALPAAHLFFKEKGGKLIYDTLEIPEDRSGPAAKNTPWLVRRLENFIEKRIIRKADKVLAVGPSVASYTAKYYGISTPEVIRNCCLYHDISGNNLIKEEIGISNSAKLGLVIGAIYNNQGLEQIIKALPYMNTNIHMAALGPVAEQVTIDNLKKMAVEYGVAERFHIIDPKPPHRLIEFASGADLGLIPRQPSCLNNRLSLPNKIFELIMSRLPVACGNLPDIKNIVKLHGVGDSFDEKDPEDIARVVNSLLKDNIKLEKLKKAVSIAAKELCWENESIKYVSFMEQK